MNHLGSSSCGKYLVIYFFFIYLLISLYILLMCLSLSLSLSHTHTLSVLSSCRFVFFFLVTFSVYQNINVCAFALNPCRPRFVALFSLSFFFRFFIFFLLSTIKGAVCTLLQLPSLSFVSLFLSLSISHHFPWDSLVRAADQGQTKNRFPAVDRTWKTRFVLWQIRTLRRSSMLCVLVFCSVNVCMCVCEWRTHARGFIYIPIAGASLENEHFPRYLCWNYSSTVLKCKMGW